MYQKLKNTLVPHRANNYKPHAISHVGLSILALFILSLQAFANVSTNGELRVLGYATNVSTSELLNLTNSNRSTNGLAGLSINSQLNAAAQAKANHMISNDYWAHVAPDGTTPWFFFGQAGYNYTRAGENLAYGYSTSSGVVTGWMNSPTHAANILDAGFSEVGFGIADGSNFQGDENTVVVALYAQPASAPIPEPEPEPVATAQEVTPPPVAPAAQEPVVTQELSPEPTPPTESTPEIELAEETNSPEEAADTNSQRYLAELAEDGSIQINGSPYAASNEDLRTTNLEALIGGQAHWTMYLILGSLAAVAGIYFVRHMHAIRQLAVHGEHYVQGHPLVEASLVYFVIWLILFATYGVVL